MKKYLWVIPLIVLLCIAFACQDKAAMAELEKYKAQAALEEQNKALTMRYEDAWLRGDIEAFKATCSPDYVSHAASEPDQSLEESVKTLKENITTISYKTYDRRDIIAKDNKVVIRYIVKYAYTGDIEGHAVKAKEVVGNGISIVRVENGKIVESWENNDSLGSFEQLGFELKPKEEKKK